MMHTEEIMVSLQNDGFTEAQVQRVAALLRATPRPKVYLWAVVFLGAATYVLALGAILLRATPDALWTAVGAGLGGLTGIFMGKQGD
jgi:hypothetical protein